MKLRELGEDEVVRRLLHRLPADRRVKVRAGDDCAVVRIRGEWQLLKTDCLVEQVHFLLSARPELVGRKALCRAISDIAAMGGRPRDALVTIAISPEATIGYLEGIYRGLCAAATEYGVNLVGGETSRSPGPLFISIAMTGEATAGKIARRAGGKGGDLLYVTGRLGGSLLRDRHLKFKPRVEEGAWLVAQPGVHAMMDLSDGLASDLPRLARASSLGFELDLRALPLNPGCTAENALRDGEDYELLVAIGRQHTEAVEARWQRRFPRLRLTRIGRLTTGSQESFATTGFDHFKGAGAAHKVARRLSASSGIRKP
jgi:thiamine-monophosphate kinase